MRIEPVRSLGRSNLRHRGHKHRDTKKPSQTRHLPVVQPSPAHGPYDSQLTSRYRPNAAFLAHLIATRDGDLQTRFKRQIEPETGTSRYRETAASPRKREAGHLIAIEF